MSKLRAFLDANRSPAARVGLFGGAVLLFVSYVLGFLNPTDFFRAYLVAFVFWFGLGLGCLAILMLHHMSGGRWGAVMLPILEAGSRTMPVLTLVGLPLYLSVPYLYAWAHPAAIPGELTLSDKAIYLNVPFFIARTIFYFVVWNALAYLMNRWSREREATRDTRYNDKLRRAGAVGIVIFGLTVTFATIDWLMSLEPDWYSTIYPAIVAIGGILSAFAFAVLMTALNARKPPMSEIVTPRLWNDLGSLLLAFVMLWAYLAYSQYLLIWMGNLVEEVPWYLLRLNGCWQFLALIVGVLYFVLPFCLLIIRAVKRNPVLLAAVAALLVAVRYVEVYWLITPVFYDTLTITVLDLLTVLGLGGVWLAAFRFELGKAPLVSQTDPALSDIHGTPSEAIAPRALS